MTKKDLIRLLIKLLGVYLLINSLPPYIGQLAFFGSNNSSWEMTLWIILMLCATIAFTCWLIFAPDSIINFFKLDKGFDDDQIKLDQLKSEKLISVAVLIVGGLFIVDSFSPLLVEIGYKIHASITSNESLFPTWGNNDNTNLYSNIIKLVIGLYLIFNFQNLTHFLAKKNNKNKDA